MRRSNLLGDLRSLGEKAQAFGWLVVHRYTDNDKSASKENVVRDDFEQLVVDLSAGHTPEGYPIHGVMADNDDRLYRRPGGWERYLRAFTAHERRVYWDSNGVQDLYAEGFEIKGLVGVAMSLAETRKKQRRSRNSHRYRSPQRTALDVVPHPAQAARRDRARPLPARHGQGKTGVRPCVQTPPGR
ncbi:hypothetical protein [Kitasatospora sp. NPDC091207]|uniref:hypothetical protein n=1 Tax=Kitasatospora sp. NPDC091207 TaxID=3364083 RepID=UPI003815B8AE